MHDLKQDFVSNVMQRTKDDLIAMIVATTLTIQERCGLTNEQGEAICTQLTDLSLAVSEHTLNMFLELMTECRR